MYLILVVVWEYLGDVAMLARLICLKRFKDPILGESLLDFISKNGKHLNCIFTMVLIYK